MSKTSVPISVQVSKSLSYLLRHGAQKEGLKMSKDGWVLLDEILQRKDFKKVDEKMIKDIVANNDKQRFALKTENGKLYIKANQGHSIKSVEIELEELKKAPTVCIHGTYSEFLSAIEKEGLCKMSRQHIHMAEGLPGDNGVISGMRKSCDIIIYLDVESAMKDGIKFYKSPNGVILSPGIGEKGVIPPKYFKKIEKIK